MGKKSDTVEIKPVIESESDALELMESTYQHLKKDEVQDFIVSADKQVWFANSWGEAATHRREKGVKLFEVKF